MPCVALLDLAPTIGPPRPRDVGEEGTWYGGPADVAVLRPGQKLLHFVRHAQGTHNVSKLPIQQRELDARLTPDGEAQCAALQRSTAALRPQLVATSPLTLSVHFGRQMKYAG